MPEIVSNPLLAAGTLWLRELVRFYRQPSRVIGALASPLLFWLLLGSGIGSSFKSGTSSSYLQYFFPGTLLMILFFTAVFSTISIIEDRKEGFLQSVLVAPIPRSSLLFGKIRGGTTLAFIRAFLFLFLAPFAGLKLSVPGWFEICIALFFNAFLMTAIGFIIAWQFHSIQGFHAVMNLLLMPMWILSGALFPEEGASGWIRVIMKCNPLSYGMTALRAPFFEGAPFIGPLLITIFLSGVIFALASISASKSNTQNFK